MAGVLTELQVAGRLAVRRLFSGKPVSTEPDQAEFRQRWQKVLDLAPVGIVRDYHWIDLPADQVPWVASNIHLTGDEQVSCFLSGRAYVNRPLDIWLKPELNVWYRIGQDGEVFRGTRSSHSFTVDQPGELLVGNYFPNDWISKAGERLQHDKVYDSMSGGATLLVIRWGVDAAKGVRALLKIGDPEGQLQMEQERQEQGDTTPAGWHYLWHLGPAEVYREGREENGQPCIHCQIEGDAGILQQDIDVPLTPDTEISWRWCIDNLPSTLREDAAPSHDYLSIAVEFDNGRDITYYWSHSLPVGTGYDCPLPNWKGKEYHVVIRSGEQGLGEWHDERRNLYQDYQHYMGQPPARITRVWLIANSVFQRGLGSCDYANIVLHQADSESKLL